MVKRSKQQEVETARGAGSAVVTVRGLKKDYVLTGAGGERMVTPVLKGLDVEITKGEFVAVMGPSGSGKSTLMNIIGCLDTPTSGSYTLNGQEVANLEEDDLARIRNRELGFVFQGFNLLPRRTVLDNVGLPLIAGGKTRDEWEPVAKKLLVRVGLEEQMYKLPSQLSGGQQQRVAIARALAGSPQVILADEPTGNLDTVTTRSVMELFRDLNREGMTIVIVTHEDDVAAYTERLVVLRDGVLQYDGTPEGHLKGSTA